MGKSDQLKRCEEEKGLLLEIIDEKDILLEEKEKLLKEKEDKLANRPQTPPQLVIVKESEKVDLKGMKAFIVCLTEPHSFADDQDYTGQFSRIIVLTRRSFDKEFMFAALGLYLDDGAHITGQAAKTWFAKTRWFSYGEEMIPVLLTLFTVADVERFMDVVIDVNTALKADSLRMLHEKVLERMVLNMQNNFKKSQIEIETYKTLAKTAEDKAELLRKRFQTDLVNLNDSFEQQTDRIAPRLKMWQLIALGSGWGIAIILLGILLGVVV